MRKYIDYKSFGNIQIEPDALLIAEGSQDDYTLPKVPKCKLGTVIYNTDFQPLIYVGLVNPDNDHDMELNEGVDLYVDPKTYLYTVADDDTEEAFAPNVTMIMGTRLEATDSQARLKSAQYCFAKVLFPYKVDATSLLMSNSIAINNVEHEVPSGEDYPEGWEVGQQWHFDKTEFDLITPEGVIGVGTKCLFPKDNISGIIISDYTGGRWLLVLDSATGVPQIADGGEEAALRNGTRRDYPTTLATDTVYTVSNEYLEWDLRSKKTDPDQRNEIEIIPGRTLDESIRRVHPGGAQFYFDSLGINDAFGVNDWSPNGIPPETDPALKITSVNCPTPLRAFDLKEFDTVMFRYYEGQAVNLITGLVKGITYPIPDRSYCIIKFHYYTTSLFSIGSPTQQLSGAIDLISVDGSVEIHPTYNPETHRYAINFTAMGGGSSSGMIYIPVWNEEVVGVTEKSGYIMDNGWVCFPKEYMANFTNFITCRTFDIIIAPVRIGESGTYATRIMFSVKNTSIYDDRIEVLPLWDLSTLTPPTQQLPAQYGTITQFPPVLSLLDPTGDYLATGRAQDFANYIKLVSSQDIILGHQLVGTSLEKYSQLSFSINGAANLKSLNGMVGDSNIVFNEDQFIVLPDGAGNFNITQNISLRSYVRSMVSTDATLTSEQKVLLNDAIQLSPNNNNNTNLDNNPANRPQIQIKTEGIGSYLGGKVTVVDNGPMYYSCECGIDPTSSAGGARDYGVIYEQSASTTGLGTNGDIIFGSAVPQTTDHPNRWIYPDNIAISGTTANCASSWQDFATNAKRGDILSTRVMEQSSKMVQQCVLRIEGTESGLFNNTSKRIWFRFIAKGDPDSSGVNSINTMQGDVSIIAGDYNTVVSDPTAKTIKINVGDVNYANTAGYANYSGVHRPGYSWSNISATGGGRPSITGVCRITLGGNLQPGCIFRVAGGYDACAGIILANLGSGVYDAGIF
jgi:hypothetical protein